MAYAARSRRERTLAAAGAAAIVAGVGWALIAGLVGAVPSQVSDPMALIEVVLPPPPEPDRPQPAPRKRARPEGEAAPPNLRAEPKPIVAPEPVVAWPVPLPAAPIAGEGPRATSGAAELPGPGTGAGGEGDGRGAGGDGDGDGGGGGGSPPIRTGGRLRDSDYPRGAREAGIGGTVEVRYLVGVKGRVERCTIATSSGNAEIDNETCRLIQKRFRFRPSRDEDGQPVPAWIVEYHSWIPIAEGPGASDSPP